MELENLITSERIALEAELTKRWQSDNASDSWLAKHTRPIIVLSLVVVLFIFIVLDSMDIAFEVRDAWVTLYEVLVVTAVGGTSHFVRFTTNETSHAVHEQTPTVPRMGLRP